MPEETIGMFQSDFKIVANLFHQLRVNKNYKAPPDVMKHAEEVLYFLKAITKDSIFDRARFMLKDKGVSTMSVVEDMVSKDIQEKWKAEWMSQAVAQGMAKKAKQIICNLLKDRTMTYDEIAQKTETSVDEVRRVADEMHLAY